jgi:hypothetical protein
MQCITLRVQTFLEKSNKFPKIPSSYDILNMTLY